MPSADAGDAAAGCAMTASREGGPRDLLPGPCRDGLRRHPVERPRDLPADPVVVVPGDDRRSSCSRSSSESWRGCPTASLPRRSSTAPATSLGWPSSSMPAPHHRGHDNGPITDTVLNSAASRSSPTWAPWPFVVSSVRFFSCRSRSSSRRHPARRPWRCRSWRRWRASPTSPRSSSSRPTRGPTAREPRQRDLRGRHGRPRHRRVGYGRGYQFVWPVLPVPVASSRS